MISQKTVFTVLIYFIPPDSDPMPDDDDALDAWKSSSQLFDELCDAIEKDADMHTEVGDITHMFRGNPAAGPYFELETTRPKTAHLMDSRIQAIITSHGGRVQ